MSGQSNSEDVYRGERRLCHTHFKEYKGSLTWIIDGFSQCEYKTGKCLTSDYFGIDGKEENLWKLLLYPRGKTLENQQFVSVFLDSKWDKTILDPVACEISIVNVSGETTVKKKWDNESDGWEDFISRSSLFDDKDLLLPQDVLTMYCEIVAVKKQEKSWKSGHSRHRSFGDDIRREKTLSSDFGELLQKDLLTDVVLHVGDAKISAHKYVLVARSSTFADMLQKDDPEAQTTNTVVIKDIEVQVFRELLSYIYTDECDLFSVQFAVKLLEAADRFTISSLMTKCYGYIKDKLSAKQAFEILTSTRTLAEGKLRQKCIDVFCNELTNLAAGGGDWKNRLPSNPEVLEDIFKNFAGKEDPTENFSVLSSSTFSCESKASLEHNRFVERSTSLLWRIGGFSLCRHLKNTKSLFSLKFGIGEDKMKFCLSLFPNGRDKTDEGFLTWFLRAEPREPVTMKLRVSFKNTNGEDIIESCDNSVDLAKYSCVTLSKLIAVEKLFGDNSLLPNDELVVHCVVRVSKLRTEKPTTVDCQVNSLAEDFGRMLEKQAATDVVLEAKEASILAHRLVLSTRSSLLASSALDFTDTKGHVLRELVHYLYTDTCSLKNVYHALDMLEATHKYDVPSLQVKCCEYLCCNLSEDIVFDVVVSAFSLQETKLYEICLDYIRQELPSVCFLPWRLKELHAHPDILKDVIARYIT